MNHKLQGGWRIKGVFAPPQSSIMTVRLEHETGMYQNVRLDAVKNMFIDKVPTRIEEDVRTSIAIYAREFR